VVCPSPPIPVAIGKNEVLVYELHLTNFDVVPLTLKRISIFAARENPDPLTTFEGEKVIDCDDPYWGANDDVRQFECGQRYQSNARSGRSKRRLLVDRVAGE
jgi:hypothetical protein